MPSTSHKACHKVKASHKAGCRIKPTKYYFFQVGYYRMALAGSELKSFNRVAFAILVTVCKWLCGRMPDLQMGGCRFESRPGLLRTKVYSAFHPSGVGKWVPVITGKAKTGMAYSDCGWTCGCAGETVKSLENRCHTWALLQWWFTTKRRYISSVF